MSDPYLYAVTNNVATFSINGAPWNLMSLEYIDRLEEQLPEVLADDQIRAMIFTGEGLDHFSAGMNLKQIPDGIKRAGSPEAFFGQRHKVLDMIERGGTPTIATLYGYCLGGGLELPLACHFRIAAATGAQIGLPEMDLGTVPAWGGSARLPRAVGRTYALDMILRGRKIDGREAYRIGLVSELVPIETIKDRAQALGEELAAQPRKAVESMLDVVVGHETKTLDESMADETAAVAANRDTHDSTEGMRAFMEKRKPVFNQ
ncbi:MAG: enoyl-CoA hydratase/isomerase family protein [Gammaproteobacteria bacterium TMED243]|nr:crotonase [Gammaproteobacteria bacterium]RPG28863.1 MAG: enoyl-CoA hydratase/isomerase family protein [Gammaproteobacteria bacterium TMED243]